VATPKEDLVRLLQQQPEDSSREELVRELAFSLMVERGLADSDARRVVPDDEMANRIRRWRK
jgi:predicted transcriptional regulator